MNRNGCPEWIGITVRNESEWVSGMRRNTQKYDFQSYNAAYRQVQQGLNEWKNAFGDQEYDRLLPENLENG